MKIGLYKSNSVEQIKNHFKDTNNEICVIEDINEAGNFDIAVLYDYNGRIKENILEKTVCINIHPSLLPAFAGENAIEQAFAAGVKVSGITVTKINTGRILAQYPVLIGVGTHIDDFLNEMVKLENILIPAVLEAIISDKVFDFSDLFSHSCSGCGKCK